MEKRKQASKATEWRNESKQASKQTNKQVNGKYSDSTPSPVLKFAAEQPVIPNLTVSVQYETERDRQIFNYEPNS
jgi:hypothetical protein